MHMQGNAPFNRAQAENPHAIVEDLASGCVQSHAGLLDLGFGPDDLQDIITGGEGVSHLKEIAEHRDGLKSLERVGQDVAVLREQANQIDRVTLGQKVVVGRQQILLAKARFPHHGAQAGVGVLQVRASITLK